MPHNLLDQLDGIFYGNKFGAVLIKESAFSFCAWKADCNGNWEKRLVVMAATMKNKKYMRDHLLNLVKGEMMVVAKKSNKDLSDSSLVAT